MHTPGSGIDTYQLHLHIFLKTTRISIIICILSQQSSSQWALQIGRASLHAKHIAVKPTNQTRCNQTSQPNPVQPGGATKPSATNQTNMQDPVVQQIHNKFVAASRKGRTAKQHQLDAIPAEWPVFQKGDVVYVFGAYSFVVGKVTDAGAKKTEVQSAHGWQGWIHNYDLVKHDGPIQADQIFDTCQVCEASPAVVSVWHQTNWCKCLCKSCITDVHDMLRTQCPCCERKSDVLIFPESQQTSQTSPGLSGEAKQSDVTNKLVETTSVTRYKK